MHFSLKLKIIFGKFHTKRNISSSHSDGEPDEFDFAMATDHINLSTSFTSSKGSLRNSPVQNQNLRLSFRINFSQKLSNTDV